MKIFLAAIALIALAACATDPDPAMGVSAKARHAEMTPTASPDGASATARHAEGNYYPLR